MRVTDICPSHPTGQGIGDATPGQTTMRVITYGIAISLAIRTAENISLILTNARVHP